jgi:hypothetical protein
MKNIAVHCWKNLPLAVGKELIEELKGSESRTTAEFEVKAPWIVDWMTLK